MLAPFQIVGGNTPGWYGNSNLHFSDTFDNHEDEFDWVDLDDELCHWTKALRPVQVRRSPYV